MFAWEDLDGDRMATWVGEGMKCGTNKNNIIIHNPITGALLHACNGKQWSGYHGHKLKQKFNNLKKYASMLQLILLLYISQTCLLGL